MKESIGSWLATVRRQENGREQLAAMLEQCLSRANGNRSRNTYLWQDADWSRSELERLLRPAGKAWTTLPLGGLPVSLKDCFDLAGTVTTQGSKFYAGHTPVATQDSWVAARLRAMGAVLTGKTHLHALAYGITGENRDYGDCLQPRDESLLTGGSSSGAVASVQEGSALAAIGTDTGGSVRVPAALCGLAGYRSSLGWGSWQGAGHLAESFDTIGWLFRYLEDAPLLAQLFVGATGNQETDWNRPRTLDRFAIVDSGFLEDCQPEVRNSLEQAVEELQALGMRGERVDVSWWEEAHTLFAPIQAAEAARIHAGNFHEFEEPIRQRLEWGASLTQSEVDSLRQRHADFRARMAALLAEHALVMLPSAPVSRLLAGEDHTGIRPRLLRYTAPASLGGLPALAVPCAAGGMQILAAHGDDPRLLQLATRLGQARRAQAE